MLLKDDIQKLISDNCILTLLCGRKGQQLALKCLEFKKKKKKATDFKKTNLTTRFVQYAQSRRVSSACSKQPPQCRWIFVFLSLS